MSRERSNNRTWLAYGRKVIEGGVAGVNQPELERNPVTATVVSFISEKGGVGKTTATYHIAIALGEWHNKRVLVVDADYQRGGLTVRFFPDRLEEFRRGVASGTTLFHAFQALYGAQATVPAPDVVTTRYAVSVMPSDPRLSGVSVDRLPGAQNLRENNRLLYKHLQLIAEVIAPHLDQYDYVLIDTHPETSDLMRSVIFASDFAVSPVKLDEQSSVGVPSAIEAVNMVNEDVRALAAAMPNLPEYEPTIFVGSIGMMTREYGGALKRSERAQARTLRDAGGMFRSYLTEGDGIRVAAERRVPVWEVEGANAARQSDQLRDIVEEFLILCP